MVPYQSVAIPTHDKLKALGLRVDFKCEATPHPKRLHSNNRTRVCRGYLCAPTPLLTLSQTTTHSLAHSLTHTLTHSLTHTHPQDVQQLSSRCQHGRTGGCRLLVGQATQPNPHRHRLSRHRRVKFIRSNYSNSNTPWGMVDL